MIPPICINFFDTRNFLQHQKGSPHEFFCDTKNFRHLFSDTLLFSLSKISHPTNDQRQKFSETPRTLYKQKNFSRNPVTPALSCIKFFNTRNFQKHQRVPLRNFSVLWDKKFWEKSYIIFYNIRIKLFDNAVFPKHQKCPLTNFFREKIFCDTPSLVH